MIIANFLRNPLMQLLGTTVEERVLVKLKADINVPHKIDEWVVTQTGSVYLDTLQYLDLVDTIGEIMQNNEINLQNKVFSTIWEESKFCEEVVSKPFFSYTKANKISLNSNMYTKEPKNLPILIAYVIVFYSKIFEFADCKLNLLWISLPHF